MKTRRKRGAAGGSSAGGPIKDMQLKYERLAIKAKKYAAKLKSFGLPDSKTLSDADRTVEWATQTAMGLASLPKDFRPTLGTVGGAPLEEGATVRFRDKALSTYQGLFTSKNLFTVERIVGRRLVCVAMDSKERIVELRSHMQRAEG